jgi:hypothetical protein
LDEFLLSLWGLFITKNYDEIGPAETFEATNMGIRATRTRRALQILWSKLDQFLAPHVSNGVLIAVSGGPDSRALLESLALWPKRNLGRLHIATIDHGMRSESAREVKLLALRAQRLGFSVHEESYFSAGLEHKKHKRLFSKNPIY